MTEKFKYFGARLGHLIEQRGLNNSRLAQEADLTRAYVGKLVNGQQLPTDKVLKRLADCLDEPVEDLAACVRADRMAQSPGFGVQLGLDPELERLVAENDVEIVATWGEHDSEAQLRQDLRRLGQAWREAALQLHAERLMSGELLARLTALGGAGGAPAPAPGGESALPFYGKVGGAWPAKPRRTIALPAEAAARGEFAAEITTGALDRVPIVAGDIVVATQERPPADGDLVLARVPGGTACLRYRAFDACALLASDSHDPGPLVPVGGDVVPFAVVTYVHRPGRAFGGAP